MATLAGEDFCRFCRIQEEKYLRFRRNGCFGSPAEKDMIRDLIAEAWEDLRDSHCLSELSGQEKSRLFSQEVIIFPCLHTPKSWF
ncbi:MAG: hypothetical protein LBQ61_02080 [Spirochaetales bacterium]|jgi:hypothetical protein|nr:hypothetical protein [Spirochaetales bacterium]